MNPRRLTQHDLLPPGAKLVGPNGLPLQEAWGRRSPAVSNTERQRQFRQRNPGYYGRLKARERAACKARVAAAQGVAEILHAYRTQPLMLPAPVEPIEIPGMTTIPLRDALPVSEFIEARRRDAA